MIKVQVYKEKNAALFSFEQRNPFFTSNDGNEFT